MKLIETFKRELKGCQIHDNYIQNSSLDSKPIEYLLFSISKHHYALSYRDYYVITEIDTPSREAYQLTKPIISGRSKMAEHLKQLKIRNIEN